MFFQESLFVGILVSCILSACSSEECACAGTDVYKCTPEIHPNVDVNLLCYNYLIITCKENTQINSSFVIPSTMINYEPSVAVINCKNPPQFDVKKKRLNGRALFLIGKQGMNFTYNRSFFKSIDVYTLSISYPDLTDLPDDLFADMWKLPELEITNTKLEKFKRAISVLSRLTSLDIALSSLSQLEERTFENTTSLRKLSLWRNQLTQLHEDDFLGLDNLKSLELFGNKIQTIHSNAFQPLKNVKYIGLKENPLKVFAEELFQHCVHLKRSGPASLDWPDHSNTFIPEVHVVNRTNQNLSELILSSSSELRFIHFGGNKIREFPDEQPFRGYRALKVLELNNNDIQELPEELLYNCRRLRKLNLNFNQIQYIPVNLFLDLTSLTELKMKNNRLKTIHSEAFRSTKKLTELELSHNQLQFNEPTVGQSPFRYLSSLSDLNLDNNQITSLRDILWEDTEHLTKLQIRNNRISTIRFEDFPKSYKFFLTLHLESNNMTTIDFHALDHEPKKATTPGPVRLHLDDHSIICDCRLLNFVKLLKNELPFDINSHLVVPAPNLYCAEPERLRGMAVRTIDSVQLECEIPDFEECPKMCHCFNRPADQSLVVNCSNAGLRYVPKLPVASTFNYSYAVLYVDNNSIGELPKDDAGYLEVREVHARGNLVKNIESGNIHDNLQLLDLRGNQIETISDRVIKIIEGSSVLKRLYLSLNNWSCDCSDQNGILFFTRNAEKILDYADLKCQSGELISSVPQELFESCNTKHLVPLGVFLILLIIFCAAAMIAFYKYEQQIKIWMYWHNILPCLFNREVLDHNKKYDAFISFSHQDEDFVVDELLPELEGKRKLNLCIHLRDWLPGDFIQEQIVKSVADSRRTLIVLSENFIRSIWGIMEFRTAHRSAMEDQVARVIIILYGQLDRESLDPELKNYIDLNTYIEYGDPWFFEKLHYALRTVKTVKKRHKVETEV